MKKIGLLSLSAATVLMAGGYKIPESSLNAVALSAANVAHAHGADAAYYNPANMIWNDNVNSLEFGLTYVGLSKVKYDGQSTLHPVNVSIESESEDFAIPNLHYVSPKLGRARVGLSIVTPAGLTKRWNDQPGRFFSKKYEFMTVEINPSVAVALSDKVSAAIGLRVLYSKGKVQTDGVGLAAGEPYSSMWRDMSGDTWEAGYNLALSYRPTPSLSLAATYRSKVDLNLEDSSAKTATNGLIVPTVPPTVVVPPVHFIGHGEVSVPVPASLNLAASYTFSSKTTVEFVYERTFWGTYDSLDFNYRDFPAEAVFGKPIPKNWKDSNSFRLGVTQEYEKWTAMAGMVIDETPIPEETLSFETPDSDSISFSLGGRYQIDDQWNVGLAGLYSIRDDRRVVNQYLNGEYKDSKVYMVSVAVEYKF